MKNGLNIAFFGSSLLSAYWNGAATYYRGIIKALHSRGHTVTFYEPDIYDRQKHRDIDCPDYARSVVYSATDHDVSRVLGMARGVDVVVKTSGVGAYDDYLEKAVLELQNERTSVVFWDVDAPATLDRVRNDQSDPFSSLISSYDLILTYGGGDPVVSAYRSFGARECIPVYNALDPDTHFPVAQESRFSGLLGFLGNRLPDREARVREFFFRAARLLPEEIFMLGGSGWDNHMPDLPNVNSLGHIFTHEHNAFNCSNLAVLNINRQSMASYGFSPPTRIFEAAGAGACIITDAWEGIEKFLRPGDECLVAQNGQDVAEYISGLDRGQALRIGASAKERILSEHTYSCRAKAVEDALWNIKQTARR